MKCTGKYKQAYTSILTTVNTPNILSLFLFIFLTELFQNSFSRRATAISILKSALFLRLILENYAFLKPGLEKSKT